MLDLSGDEVGCGERDKVKVKSTLSELNVKADFIKIREMVFHLDSQGK